MCLRVEAQLQLIKLTWGSLILVCDSVKNSIVNTCKLPQLQQTYTSLPWWAAACLTSWNTGVAVVNLCFSQTCCSREQRGEKTCHMLTADSLLVSSQKWWMMFSALDYHPDEHEWISKTENDFHTPFSQHTFGVSKDAHWFWQMVNGHAFLASWVLKALYNTFTMAVAADLLIRSDAAC